MKRKELAKTLTVAGAVEAGKLAIAAGFCVITGRVSPDAILAGYFLSTTLETAGFAAVAIALKNSRIKLLEGDVDVLGTKLRTRLTRESKARVNAQIAAALARQEQIIAQNRCDQAKAYVRGKSRNPPADFYSDN